MALLLAAALFWIGLPSLPTHAAAQPTLSQVSASAPERSWRVVTLNDGDPTLPAFIALDTATRAAMTAPGRHPVDSFSETLDALRFPGAQLEDEIVALL